MALNMVISYLYIETSAAYMKGRFTIREDKNEMPGIRRFTGKPKKAWERRERKK